MARLNTNILYLCYTQRVKLSTLSPNHTLENISKLLNLECSDLGRIGPVDTNDGFTGQQNIQLMQNLTTGSTDSASDDEGTNEPCYMHYYIRFSSYFSTDVSNDLYAFCIAR